MDQGVKYVVSIQDINGVATLHKLDVSAQSAERSVDSLNSTLRNVAGALGVGLGLHQLIDFGKDAVQGAADYETAVKRIKFASEGLLDGARNISFISAEADKFKIPLQRTTEAYGEFLAMLKGSGIAGDQVRKLHDELLLIGKVKAIGDGQLDAAVRNIGKMMESGSLDARHFRPLEQQLSGIGAFVAQELGISVHQLAILRNKGKMTQIDPKVLLTAIEKQAKSLEQFFPESITTMQSQINDLDNDWLRFKNDLVFENIGELRELFETLKGGVSYLKEHEDQIIRYGKIVIGLGKVWLEYKATMLLINTAQAAYNGFMAGYAGRSAAVVSAAEGQAVAYNTLAASIERLIYVQATANGMPTLAAMSAANAARMASGGAAGAATGGALATGATAGSKIIRGATAVTIAYFAAEALSQLGNNSTPEGFKFSKWDYLKAPSDMLGFSNDYTKVGALASIQDIVNNSGKIFEGSSHELIKTINEGFEKDGARPAIREFANMLGSLDKRGYRQNDDSTLVEILKREGVRFMANEEDERRKSWKEDGYYEADIFPGLPFGGKKIARYPQPGDTKTGGGGGDGKRYQPPNDKITGQRVISYNYHVNEINGIKSNTVTKDGQMNTEDVAEKLRDAIQSTIEDMMLKSGN